MWQHIITLAILLPASLVSTAQKSYSLDECMELALERNNRLKVAETDSKVADIQLKQSKEAFIPSLNISNQHNISIGRVLDPTTYSFIENRTVYDMNATLIGSMTLFSGLDRYHNVGKARLNTISSQLSVEETELELMIDVMSRYFQILLDKEAVSICKGKISLLSKQEEQISKRIEYKAAVPADLLNVQADITSAKVELVNATGNLQADIVSLCALLEIADWQSFDVSITDIDISRDTIPDMITSDDLDGIVSNLPSVRLSQVKSDIAESDVKIASASYWPTLRINAGFGTTFSNARSKTGGISYSLKEQFNDNMNSYISMIISIPLLNAITTSKTVKEKELNYSRARYEEEENRISWEKEIAQAVVLTQSAYSKHKLLSDDVSKFEEALDIIEEKYALGAATYYDYQTAVNNLYQSKDKESQAAFEYLLRKKIIELYLYGT